MKITIRANSVTIDGYVNAVERFSKPLADNRGKFIERIMPGAFSRALQSNENVLGLLNHWSDHQIAEQADGSLKLVEDNIGLRATITTSDARVMEKTKAGKLRGWSFGFSDPKQSFKTGEGGMEERTITDLYLHEVSVLDDEKIPAYYGTSVEMRAGDNSEPIIIERRAVVEAEPEYVTIRNEEGEGTSEAAGDTGTEGNGGGDSHEDDAQNPPDADHSVAKAKISKLKQEG